MGKACFPSQEESHKVELFPHKLPFLLRPSLEDNLEPSSHLEAMRRNVVDLLWMGGQKKRESLGTWTTAWTLYSLTFWLFKWDVKCLQFFKKTFICMFCHLQLKAFYPESSTFPSGLRAFLPFFKWLSIIQSINNFPVLRITFEILHQFLGLLENN